MNSPKCRYCGKPMGPGEMFSGAWCSVECYQMRQLEAVTVDSSPPKVPLPIPDNNGMACPAPSMYRPLVKRFALALTYSYRYGKDDLRVIPLKAKNERQARNEGMAIVIWHLTNHSPISSFQIKRVLRVTRYHTGGRKWVVVEK